MDENPHYLPRRPARTSQSEPRRPQRQAPANGDEPRHPPPKVFFQSPTSPGVEISTSDLLHVRPVVNGKPLHGFRFGVADLSILARAAELASGQLLSERAVRVGVVTTDKGAIQVGVAPGVVLIRFVERLGEMRAHAKVEGEAIEALKRAVEFLRNNRGVAATEGETK